MTHCVKDSQIHRKGRHILTTLSSLVKTISELKHYVDPVRVQALCHCEDTLMNVMIDVASICTDGASWPILRRMLIEAGADIPEDLDRDLDAIQ